MKTQSRIAEIQNEMTGGKSFGFDTSFLLFFLAVEFGRTVFSLSFDNAFLFLTLLMVAVLPYFLLSDEKPTFGNWLLGRSLIVGLAILLGAMFKQSLGVVLPETFRFLPMTLLIATAMLSCYVQFYGFFKLRLAK
jgi:hypothetical protein